jgi:hypothetical protein
LISLFNLSTISADVFLGTAIPYSAVYAFRERLQWRKRHQRKR